MWIKYKLCYGQPVLANVQRFGIEPTTITDTDGAELDGGTIVDLDVTERQDLLGYAVDSITGALDARVKYNPDTNHEYFSGEIHVYDSYNRAVEVLEEIKAAIVVGQALFEMPDT